MEHFNKHSFIGAQIWSAIKILTPEHSKSRFEYNVGDKRVYCENYGNNSFAIRELKPLKSL